MGQELIALPMVPLPAPRSPPLAVELQLRRRDILSAHLDSPPLDAILALPQSRGLHEPARKAFEHRVRLDDVSRVAWDLRHDVALGAEQRLEERRLPRVGP